MRRSFHREGVTVFIDGHAQWPLLQLALGCTANGSTTAELSMAKVPLREPESPCSSLPNPLERGIKMQTELLKVTGMTCGGCIGSVTRALKAIAGVGDVEVSLPAGEAVVEYDENLTSPEQLKSAVTGAGFGVDASSTAQKSQGKGCCGG
ncbi:MAG: heavy-metal-associated domain-containing protein [Betaproteobacteria bacterium]